MSIALEINKALSEQQVSDLGAGRGMGLAMAAELNGYPGPSHVLELADKLELSADQRDRIKALFDSMKAEAQPLGSRLIAQETVLDKLFANRSITPANLKVSTVAFAATQGELREPSQISPIHRRSSERSPDAEVCRVTRLYRRYRPSNAPPSLNAAKSPQLSGFISRRHQDE